jgi:hypothetical protein
MGGGGGGGATHIATSQIGYIYYNNNSDYNYLFTGDANNPTAKSGLLLVAGGGGGGAYISCVAGAGGGSNWNPGSNAQGNFGYTSAPDVTLVLSQGGKGKDYNDAGNQRGGSGGHGGGFITVGDNGLSGQKQTYGGFGASGWVISDANTTNGFTATGRRSGAGQAIVTWVNTPFQGAVDYTLQADQNW